MSLSAWSPEQLRRLGEAPELEIATRRADDTLRGWVPIWVVCAAGQVYVRTWYRRDFGWYGYARENRRARVRASGCLQADVTVEDATDRDRVDAAYTSKYGHGPSVDRMIGAEAAATTLRLRLVQAS